MNNIKTTQEKLNLLRLVKANNDLHNDFIVTVLNSKDDKIEINLIDRAFGSIRKQLYNMIGGLAGLK